MTDDVREVLSALIDREPVDPDLLAHVLEEPANRVLLVDFVRVRAAIQTDEPDEPAWTPAGVRTGQRTSGSWLRRAAAVFLLIGAGAGAGVWTERLITQERPPEPARIVRLQSVP